MCYIYFCKNNDIFSLSGRSVFQESPDTFYNSLNEDIKRNLVRPSDLSLRS